MNKKLAFIPASLIIAGALALTGCGVGQNMGLNRSMSAVPFAPAADGYTALHGALQDMVHVAQSAADRVDRVTELQFRKLVKDSITPTVYYV